MQVPELLRDAQPLISEFLYKINHDWRHKTICGQHVVNTTALREWMARKHRDGNVNNADALLRIVKMQRPGKNKFFSITSSMMLWGEESFVLIFSILLQMNRGHLIEIFADAKVTDRQLESLGNSKKHLLAELAAQGVPDFDINAFERAKWPFCNAKLALRMKGRYTFDRFTGGNYIMPYCIKRRVNLSNGEAKGGTACVYRVLMQKDLALDESFRKGMANALIKHPDYGMCYEFALKTYSAESRSYYESERDAFQGIIGQRGMVEYLGEYVHEEEEEDGGNTMGSVTKRRVRTFNILLEWGQLDLDQYFFDSKSYPPVRTKEIMKFYQNIFEVAEAIKRIHKLEKVENGEKRVYSGWHCDIKPDNILRMKDGKFKLTDFGFAKFRLRSDKDGERAQATIDFGTLAYSAPEVNRHAGSSLPLIDQTIDVWSYGCVLSITATWVVLGYQGIIQYEEVRRQAIQRLKKEHEQGKRGAPPRDGLSFHNCDDVLPEIKHWHDFLRKNMRRSDGTTGKVLDLIDNNLLIGDPEYRFSSTDLCDELSKILGAASADHNKDLEDGVTKRTDDSILSSLLAIDYAAQGDVQSERILRKTQTFKLDLTRPRPALPSKRIGKKEERDNITLAQTAYREEVIMEENPSLADAALADTQSEDLPVEEFTANKSHASSLGRTKIPILNLQATSAPEPGVPDLKLPSAQKKTPKAKVKTDGSLENETYYAEVEAQEDQQIISGLPGISLKAPENELLPSPPPQNKIGSLLAGQTPGQPISSRLLAKRPSTALTESPGSSKQASIDIRRTSVDTIGKERNSNRTLGTQTSTSTTDIEAVRWDTSQGDQNTKTTFQMPNTAPVSTYRKFDELPFKICEIRKAQLSRSRPVGERVKRLVGKYVTDPELAPVLRNRDMVFIVDNSQSMFKYRHIAMVVLETLAVKLEGLDKDGIDVHFTFFGEKLDFKRQKRDLDKRCRKSMDQAWPKTSATDGNLVHKTDMANTLGGFFEERNKAYSHPKDKTIIFLTDGNWQEGDDAGDGKSQDSVAKKIVDFCRHHHGKSHGGKGRKFTIQFIRFGDDVQVIRKLASLDDFLPQEYGIEDIVDHTPWTSDPNKMILGSFQPEWDKTDTTHMNYDENLDPLFEEFCRQRP